VAGADCRGVRGGCRAQPERDVADIRADPGRAVRPEGEAAGIDRVARALSLAAEAEEEAAAGVEDPGFVGLDVGDDDPAARVLQDGADVREEVGVVAVDLAELEVDGAFEGGTVLDRSASRVGASGGQEQEGAAEARANCRKRRIRDILVTP